MNAAQAWLVALRFWIEIPLGALGLLLLSDLTGGRWADRLRPTWLKLVRLFWFLAVAFVPVILFHAQIYPEPSQRGHAHSYMKPGFVALRAVVYFTIWIWLSRRAGRGWRFAGIGLVAYGLSSSFAAFDWVIALDPEFHSTIMGMVAWSREALAGFSAALVWAGFSGADPRESRGETRQTRLDLGNLLLAIVMVWSYLSFVQYLIVWMGNMPEETHWFVARNEGGWQWWIRSVGLFQFVLPFFLLLFRRLKSQPRQLAWIAIAVSLSRLAEVYWYLVPSFTPGHVTGNGLLVAFLGIPAALVVHDLRQNLGKERASD